MLFLMPMQFLCAGRNDLMNFTVYKTECMAGNCRKCGFKSSSFFKCPINATEDQKNTIKVILWDTYDEGTFVNMA